MTTTIKTRSPQSIGKIVPFVRHRSAVHSEDKLNWFYGVGAAAFVVSAVALQVGVWLDEGPASPQRIDVRIVQSPSSATPSGK